MMHGQGGGEIPGRRKTMDGAEATTILLASKLPPPRLSPDGIVAKGWIRLRAYLDGAAGAGACDLGDAKEPKVEFKVLVTHPPVLKRLLWAGMGEDPGFHAAEVSALLNIPRGPMPLYRLARRALKRQSGMMGEDLARKDCATMTVGSKSHCRVLVNGLCHLVDDTYKCNEGKMLLDDVRIGRTVFFRGLLEEVRINILKDTPNQTPEQTGVMMAWWEGISVLQGDGPR